MVCNEKGNRLFEDTYSLLPNFVEWFLANILVTKGRSHLEFSALDLESKL